VIITARRQGEQLCWPEPWTRFSARTVRDRGQFAVGVHNATDFLRPATSGRAEVIAEPLQQGHVQQLWLVTITGERGKALARGQLRLQNVPLPGTGTN